MSNTKHGDQSMSNIPFTYRATGPDGTQYAIRIDIDQLVKQYGPSAKTNRSLKTKLAHGAIVIELAPAVRSA